MLGIVTVDDIIDFLEDEATEDYAKFAGILMVNRPWEGNYF